MKIKLKGAPRAQGSALIWRVMRKAHRENEKENDLQQFESNGLKSKTAKT